MDKPCRSPSILTTVSQCQNQTQSTFSHFCFGFLHLPRIPFEDLYPSLFTLNMHLNSTKESGRKNHLKRESEVTANITVTRMQFIQIQFLADLKRVQPTCKTRLLWELILTFPAASSTATAYLYSSVVTSIAAKNLTLLLTPPVSVSDLHFCNTL